MDALLYVHVLYLPTCGAIIYMYMYMYIACTYAYTCILCIHMLYMYIRVHCIYAVYNVHDVHDVFSHRVSRGRVTSVNRVLSSQSTDMASSELCVIQLIPHLNLNAARLQQILQGEPLPLNCKINSSHIYLWMCIHVEEQCNACDYAGLHLGGGGPVIMCYCN